jgi:hypothetical protein
MFGSDWLRGVLFCVDVWLLDGNVCFWGLFGKGGVVFMVRFKFSSVCVFYL